MKCTTLGTIGIAILLSACGSLEKKAALLNVGDTKEKVIAAMGAPRDRQVQGQNEAWQYCKTGAGFGYHDYRTIWFYQGVVTGINSYKSSRAGASCVTDIRPLRWEDAPDRTIEIRHR